MNSISNGRDIVLVPNGRQFQVIATPLHRLTFPQAATRRWSGWSTMIFVIALLVSAPQPTRAASYTANDIMTATNAVRQAQGLPALTVNTQLTSAANAKASDMFSRQYFNHYSPTGQAPWFWIKQSGYQYTEAGENLAIDFIDGSDVVDAWMKSAGHRENLLNPKFHDIGVAVTDGTMNGNQTTIVVQFFGSRQLVATTSAPVVVTAPPVQKPVAKPAQKPVVHSPAPVLAPPAPPVVVTPSVVVPAATVPAPIEQATVLGATEPTPAPPPPVALRASPAPSETLATNDGLSQLPAIILGTFAVYAAVLGLAGVLSYLYKHNYPQVVEGQGDQNLAIPI